jgi:transglutaminase-like putative cysteine protease
VRAAARLAGLIASAAAACPTAACSSCWRRVSSAVLLEFHHFFGKEPGIALLAGLLSLKLLETDCCDARAAVLLSLFMQLGQFLYQQDMAIAALALLGTLASIGTLLALQGRAEAVAPRALAALRLLLQALPLMLVLFLLFPRVQGPCGGCRPTPTAPSAGSPTTCTGRHRAGQRIGRDRLPRRLRGRPAAAAERYWRGPVLTRFDGRTWRPGPSSGRPALLPEQGTAYPYTLTLEPHNQHWLLALDFPARRPAAYGDDFRLLSREPVRSRLRLELVAHPATPVGLTRPATCCEALALPPGFNPRTRALGEQLRAAAGRADDIPALAIRHFRDSRLAYTLTPPLGRDDVDSFLFDTRQGFCEHFAAAFVVTMRAAGVPARVVTGYQGGEINPVDGTLVVRQSDAHAWAEVWLAGKGWLRVDPTAASAPGASTAASPRPCPAPPGCPCWCAAICPGCAACATAGRRQQPLEPVGSRVQSGPPASSSPAWASATPAGRASSH